MYIYKERCLNKFEGKVSYKEVNVIWLYLRKYIYLCVIEYMFFKYRKYFSCIDINSVFKELRKGKVFLNGFFFEVRLILNYWI